MDSALTVYKLIVLYLLDRSGEELSQSFISSFLLEKGYATLVSLMQTYDELLSNGLISLGENSGTDYYSITSEGRETVVYFGSDLGKSIREDADAFLKENGIRIRQEKEITGEWYKRPSNDYVAQLKAVENGLPLVEISISVPDAGSAEHVIDTWKKNNQEIYLELVKKLF